MCDTFVALPNVILDGSVIFGKNSDRPAGEIQDVVTFPAQTYPPDLVRLGLERGETAFAALQVIINLLEPYGQGGNCAEHFSFTYHNSFLRADPREAWVLETAGKYWVAQRVIQGTRSIFNTLSIRSTGDLHHSDVVRDAIAKGRCR